MLAAVDVYIIFVFANGVTTLLDASEGGSWCEGLTFSIFLTPGVPYWDRIPWCEQRPVEIIYFYSITATNKLIMNELDDSHY
ncbi:uncharacterized protein EV420DRAFT_1633556 [Desarmillaria tabescens]|uniref:Uncharacterized protein n=1 Tax=Armillaria tabescens TaxID=1929756 RepID=A0AA39U844_ARMTA|nr:uncharacterized protein EV420DRAFT_1633556 [Desarmillaria tabescens]KAK0469125.1 hypothetical protein EV420DRAFT_1633556 [Desarmillaria tabescens]